MLTHTDDASKNKKDASDKGVYKPLPAGWDLTKTNIKK